MSLMSHNINTPNTETAISLWLKHLQSQGLATDTKQAYERDIKHLTVLYPLSSPSQYEPNHLTFALGRLHGDGIQPRSLARMLSAWRNFFNWYSEHYQTGYNPTLGVQAPYGHYPDPKILSIDQTERLLNFPADPTDPVAMRDQAIFELLYSSGLRLAEIIALDIQSLNESEPPYQSAGWINMAEHEVEIHTTEHRQRTVPIGSKAVTALENWLLQRHQLLKPELLHEPSIDWSSFAALFLGVRGLRISPRVIQKQLQLRAQQVGISTAVFPHRLRNSFANHLLESSRDTLGVQQLLGHATISSTQSLRQLNPEQLAQFMQAHPHHKKSKETKPTKD